MLPIDRRTFIGGAGSTLLTGLIAGCTGNDGGGGGESTPTDTATPTETATPTQTEAGGNATGTEASAGDGNATGTGNATEGGGVPQEVSSWLQGAAGYDGSIEDLTGSNSATVKVGAESENGYFAFEPAAIRVSTGTEVTWQWTGQGGAHNVVEESEAFTSGDPETGSNVTYNHTFEKAGTYLYYCAPHRSLGMKGAVVVE